MQFPFASLEAGSGSHCITTRERKKKNKHVVLTQLYFPPTKYYLGFESARNCPDQGAVLDPLTLS